MNRFGNRIIVIDTHDWHSIETFVRASNVFQVAEALLEKRAAWEKEWTIIAVLASNDLDE